MCKKNGVLYIVPVHIGNINDITNRALIILKKVDLIASEDKRKTGILLNYFSIKNKLFLLNSFNEMKKSIFLLNILKLNKNIALVSNAGTPIISDPGFFLVNLCKKNNIKIIPIPGACSIITAIIGSGIPSNKFCYEGFLSNKCEKRKKRLNELKEETRTLVIFESTHRVLETLNDIIYIFGKERYIVLVKDISKTWETIYGDTIINLINWIQSDLLRIKGELILVIKGYKKNKTLLSNKVLKTLNILKKYLTVKQNANITSKIHGIKKNILYKYLINKL